MNGIYTIKRQDKDGVQSELFARIGFIPHQLWPVMSLVVWGMYVCGVHGLLGEGGLHCY